VSSSTVRQNRIAGQKYSRIKNRLTGGNKVSRREGQKVSMDAGQ
jgi:hypothetical protein